MATKAQPIPPGHHTLNMHLSFKDATTAMAFYKKAFAAEQHGETSTGPGGQGVMHAELKIGDTVIFLADDMMNSGKTVEAGFAAALYPHFAVTDTDAWYSRAIAAGCKPVTGVGPVWDHVGI